MGKLAIFVIAIILLAIWWLTSKIKSNKEAEKKPFLETNLDEKLQMLKDELAELENTLPYDLAEHEAMIRDLKAKIERVKELKKKLEN